VALKLRDIYAQDGLTFSIEFFPPKNEEGIEKLFVEIEVLKALEPDFCSVTYGAGGSTSDTSIAIVKRIKAEFGIEIMVHLTIVGQPKSKVMMVLEDMWASDLHNVIALAGDPPGGPAAPWRPHEHGFGRSEHLVTAARNFEQDWFSIAVAGFPETHPRAASRASDLGYLKEKVNAGADVIITQLFFDNEDYYRYVDDVRNVGIEVPIVPGMLPILSSAQCRRFTNLCGSKIPPRLDELLTKYENDDEGALQMGIEYCTEQCQGLIEYGVPGLHFYALNRSRSIAAIHENLNLGALTTAAR
jgi:methylenetetrahydrofolate reductase (NADPH)